MIKFSIFSVVLITGILLSGCGSATSTPITTIQDQTIGFHQQIEKASSEKHGAENYQSLSFGKMKVFKPAAFVRLDSIYTIKQNYLNKDDLRGLHNSGIEEMIPAYRAEAMQVLDEVQYEFEHIYQLTQKDSIEIHHEFFLFDYKDSLINVTPFYDFKLPKSQQDLYYSYQFDYHFVTNRNFFISEAELEFLRFFKNRKIELIGSTEFQPFMIHTMNVMEAAKKAGSVDFRRVSKIWVITYFKELGIDLTIEKLGNLMALEKNGNVIGYELEVEWNDESEKVKFAEGVVVENEEVIENSVKKSTLFSFSPYLEITSIYTKKL